MNNVGFFSYDTPIIINGEITTFKEAFEEYDCGCFDLEHVTTVYNNEKVQIKKLIVSKAAKITKIIGTHGWEIALTDQNMVFDDNLNGVFVGQLKQKNTLFLKNTKNECYNCKPYILVSDYIDDLWVQGYKLNYTSKTKSLFAFQPSNRSYPELNQGNIKQSFRYNKILQLSDEDFRQKPGIDMVRTKSSKNKGNIPNKILLDSDFGRFIGLYYAEGHNSDGELAFSFNENEHEYIDFVSNYLKNKMTLKHQIRHNKKTHSVQVCFYSRTLGVLLDILIGKYSYKKKLHKTLFYTPISFREGIIRGIVEGDGNCGEWGCGITTVSKNGAFSIGYLLNTMGVSTTIVKYNPRADTNRMIIGKHVSYYIKINKFDIIDKKYNFGKTSKLSIKNRIMKPKHYYIRKIEKINNTEKVYNIVLDSEDQKFSLPFGLVVCGFCNNDPD